MKVILWGMRLILYLLPLSLAMPVSWDVCGKDLWIKNAMIPIDGVLTSALRVGPKVRARVNSVHVDVEYTYTYGEKSYVGRNLTFCPGLSTGSSVDYFYERFQELRPKIGKNITVWIDPANPENSVLFRYVPGMAIVILIGIFMFGLALLRRLDIYLTKLLRKRFDPLQRQRR